ncbi:ATP-grasp domain-containing protein [Botrimarina colliarenosi]|uniref:ATP-grasp domain-containing protein n=1 Tax=Botrimarina colliarenosi TaxID=2528001 RepID=UPI0018D46A32|nr:ATP-grasp domain-containing protein [Botrimarina colliarenosi]
MRAGFEVVGADLFADSDLDGVCPVTKIDRYPDGLSDWLAAQDVDAWMYTGALENYPDLVEKMTTIAPLWGVHGETLRRCRDPLVLQDVFAAEGIAFPETLPRNTPPTDDTLWLAKTYRHSAGAGVWRYGEQPTGADVYAQRFAEGTPESVLFTVSSAGVTLLGKSEQQLRSGFGYAGSIVSTEHQGVDAERFAALGRVLSERLALRGLVGVDYVAQGQRFCVIEINPRYTASVEVLERATGVSAVAAHAGCFARACQSKPSGERVPVVGKRVLYAPRRIDIDQELAMKLLDLSKAGRVADVPRVGATIGAGEPFCTILEDAASLSEVRAKLDLSMESLLSLGAAPG